MSYFPFKVSIGLTGLGQYRLDDGVMYTIYTVFTVSYQYSFSNVFPIEINTVCTILGQYSFDVVFPIRS